MDIRGARALISCTGFLFILSQVGGDRTSRKIYVEITGINACFRRMNATHQTGCNSARGGNVGVVHYVQSDADMTWLIEKGPHSPYAVVITPQMFSRNNIAALQASKKINGMLVIHVNQTEKPDHFSTDQSCPDNGYGMYKDSDDYKDCRKVKWNPGANALSFEDYDFPIVAISNHTEVDYLISNCYEKFNQPDALGTPRTYPLCAALVKDAMDAAKDTPTCIRRSTLRLTLNQDKYCDPLGDQNTFAFTRPLVAHAPFKNDSIILAATRMDGFSLFDTLTPNAGGTAAGVVTLLAAAHAIGKVKDTLGDDHKPIMFTFFTGEAYEYIGSSRMVYDMEHAQFPTPDGAGGPNGTYPIHIHQLKAILEVGQVALPNPAGKMWVHSDPLSPEEVTQKVGIITSMLQQSAKEVDLDIGPTGKDQPLPSASSQSFLKKRKLPVVFIADHQGAFNNKYYNSRFDVAETIKADYPPEVSVNETYDYITIAAAHLQKVSTVLARTLFTMATNDTDASHVVVDNKTVANLLYCFLHSPTCELFKQVIPEDSIEDLSKTPYPFYVGVSIDHASPNEVSYFTRNLLAYFLGDHLNVSSKKKCKSDTDKAHKYMFLAGPLNPTQKRPGVCIRSTANYSLARSPAFDIPGYDWSSNEYSSWTESQWAGDAMRVRIFLVPSKEREIAILCGGLGFAAVATLTIYLVNRGARSMFTYTE